MNKTAIFIIIPIILIGALLWAWQSGTLAKIFAGPTEYNNVPEGIILFYGEGCPHCKNVDDFISQNNIQEKVEFSNLEVWNNEGNREILRKVIQTCGIASDQVGVPLLYDGKGTCLMGDVDAINFLKNAAGINQ